MLEQENQLITSSVRLGAPEAQSQQEQQQQQEPQQSNPLQSPRPSSTSSHEHSRLDEKNPQQNDQQQQLIQPNNQDRASSPPPQIGQHNPLNEHDYCSPNKRLTQKSESISNNSNRGLTKDSESTFDGRGLSSSTPSVPEPSTSDGVELDRHGHPNTNINININNSARSNRMSMGDYGNESDSSSTSSSSLSSSVASSRDLVIAQDHQKARPIAPKDTPSVSRPRPGRPRKKPLPDNQPASSTSQDQGRSRRPRQNTSVTDKSEWITGEEQIDSALSEHLSEVKANAHGRTSGDSAPSQYTSSDYSSSDADSDDQDSGDDSEDDPNRLWCVCRKPYDNKFMICCDICKDWFHGHCVGVTKLMGDRFEKEGKEWFCAECQEKLRTGIPRHAIPSKIVKKEKKKKKSKQIAGKRGRGRPRKSESSATNTATRFSLRNARRSTSSLDPKLGVDNGRLKKNLSRPDLRSESFGEFENEARLKELIKERKKEFFHKRRLAEMQKAERRNALGLGKQSLTALSDSLDHLASSTSTPNMSNLPINIKSEDLHHQKERSKPNIVLQINTKKELGADQGNSRIVTAIVKSPTKNRQSSDSTSNNPTATDLFTAEPIQISKKSKPQESSISPAPGDSSTSTNGASKKPQSSSSSGSSSKHHDKAEASEKATPKKKRKTSESSTPNGSATPIGSKHIIQKIKDSLEERSKKIEGISVSLDQIGKLSVEIESHLNECFKEGSQKYLNKFRSLLFNLRDQKNEALVKNVLSGEITPSRLVRMSPDELASSELAKWRERENKHSIELIKRDAQLAAQQVIVKKTHKGEEVISAPAVAEPDPAVVVESQETPTTPTNKLSISKSEPSKGSPSPASDSGKPSPTLVVGKSKAPPAKSDSTVAKTSQNRTSSTPEDVTSLPFLDTTKDHKNHIFDINCRICTKKESSESVKEEKVETEPKAEQTPPQPKRLRVSIETKLDPANLSRMKEPLIKPSQATPMDVDEHSPSYPPTTPPMNRTSYDEDKEEVMYDPELPLANEPVEPDMPLSDQECWSGTISMPDVGTFSALARPVSGSVEFMREEVNANLTVCGRIAPDQVHGYIKKLKATKNQILLIQIHPKIDEERDNFNVFFDYLYSRNRYGVIQSLPNLKDFYLLPLHEKSSIPEILRPIKGLDRSHPNCLLGVLVKCRRTSSASSGPIPVYNPSSTKTK